MFGDVFKKIYLFIAERRVVLIIFLLAAPALSMRFWFFFNRAPPTLPRQDSYVGIIDEDPQDKEISRVFPISIRDSEVRVRVYTSRYPKYQYGDELEITGRLSAPSNFKSDNGQTFDYEHYLEKDDIYYELKNPEIHLLGQRKGNSVVSWLLSLKHRFLSHLKGVLGEPHASLAGGLVVGEKSALGKDLIDDFRRAGLIHIVVLSGYNITIVAAAIRRMLSFLPRSIAIVIGGVCMILFCVLVGGGATVVRSCLMAMIGLVGEMTYRQYRAGRALGIAAYLMLMQNPSILLYDPSFQLSFLATLALILLASPIERWLAGLPRFIRLPEAFGIRGLVATTLATQIFVSPFIFYLMGQVSIIGVFVNIIVLPLIPITMFVVAGIGIGGFLYGSIGHAVAVLFSFPAHMFLSYELTVVQTSAHLPHAVLVVQNFSFVMMCGVYAIYLFLFLHNKYVAIPSISPPSQNSLR